MEPQEAEKIIMEIIRGVEDVVGPVAVNQANKVKGLKIGGRTVIDGNPRRIMDELLDRYVRLIGPVAVMLAKKSIKEAMKNGIKCAELPERIKGD